MRPKFNDLVYKSAAKPAAKKGAAKKEVLWNTPEKIAVKTNYTAKDLEGIEKLLFVLRRHLPRQRTGETYSVFYVTTVQRHLSQLLQSLVDS